jgi:hypothetical protein
MGAEITAPKFDQSARFSLRSISAINCIQYGNENCDQRSPQKRRGQHPERLDSYRQSTTKAYVDRTGREAQTSPMIISPIRFEPISSSTIRPSKSATISAKFRKLFSARLIGTTPVGSGYPGGLGVNAYHIH